MECVSIEVLEVDNLDARRLRQSFVELFAQVLVVKHQAQLTQNIRDLRCGRVWVDGRYAVAKNRWNDVACFVPCESLQRKVLVAQSH